MPRLYGTWRSRATRPLWLAGEIGLDLDIVPVWQAYRIDDPLAPEAPLNTRSPAFLAISPAGTVPVLDDDGLILGESLAITLHMARRWGGDLGPRDEGENALMEHWALYGATAIEDAALALQTLHGEGRQETDAGRAGIAALLARLARPLAVLEGHLARDGQMVGGRFSVADINMAEIIRYATAEPAALAPWPAIAGWLARCQSRPAFKAMWARRLAEPARP
ncbi:MAG: glutathione S-transferase family protein [Rubellimicrobium sp.]|nr:glutathione S-transferase family protein [Rubellimicrobium sp.]